MEQTFATEEGERVCLRLESLDLALSGDRGRDGGSEFALRVGRFVIGNKSPPGPGLADRESRDQGISPSQSLHNQIPRAAAGSAVAVYYCKCIRDLR
jgi:hypothetical protein